MYRVGRPGQTMCINEGLATSRRYPGLCGTLLEIINDVQCSSRLIVASSHTELLSGVDYREPVCYPAGSAAPGAPAIDQAQQQLAPAAATPLAPAQQPPTPILQPPPMPPPSSPPLAAPPVLGEMILRGIQSPFAGLAKLLNQYNLFG